MTDKKETKTAVKEPEVKKGDKLPVRNDDDQKGKLQKEEEPAKKQKSGDCCSGH
jgi:hypothetical protein